MHAGPGSAILNRHVFHSDGSAAFFCAPCPARGAPRALLAQSPKTWIPTEAERMIRGMIREFPLPTSVSQVPSFRSRSRVERCVTMILNPPRPRTLAQRCMISYASKCRHQLPSLLALNESLSSPTCQTFPYFPQQGPQRIMRAATRERAGRPSSMASCLLVAAALIALASSASAGCLGGDPPPGPTHRQQWSHRRASLSRVQPIPILPRGCPACRADTVDTSDRLSPFLGGANGPLLMTPPPTFAVPRRGGRAERARDPREPFSPPPSPLVSAVCRRQLCGRCLPSDAGR